MKAGTMLLHLIHLISTAALATEACRVPPTEWLQANEPDHINIEYLNGRGISATQTSELLRAAESGAAGFAAMAAYMLRWRPKDDRIILTLKKAGQSDLDESMAFHAIQSSAKLQECEWIALAKTRLRNLRRLELKLLLAGDLASIGDTSAWPLRTKYHPRRKAAMALRWFANVPAETKCVLYSELKQDRSRMDATIQEQLDRILTLAWGVP